MCKKMKTEQSYNKLSNIFWDYDFTEEELRELLYGNIEVLGSLDRSQLLRRMFEYLNWFDVITFIDKEFFLANITQEFIKTLKGQDLKQGLLFVREFLQRKAVSVSG